MNKNRSGVKIEITRRQKVILKELKKILSREESFIMNTAAAYFIVYANDGNINLPYHPQCLTVWSSQVLDNLSSRSEEWRLTPVSSEAKDKMDFEVYFDQSLLDSRYLPDSVADLSGAYIDLILDFFLSVLGVSSNGDQDCVEFEPYTPSKSIKEE